MAEALPLIPGTELRKELDGDGIGHVSRCYQCATCSSVCELSSGEFAFPRRQMVLAQWGQVDRLSSDPAVWLCHGCADCSERCPRDVRPADVLQGIRRAVIRNLAFPRFAGALVGKARVTWPLLLAVPWLFWIGLLAGTGNLAIPDGPIVYEKLVSHGMLYAVYFPVAGWVTLAALVSGAKLWKRLGRAQERKGTFVTGLWSVMVDVALHRSFGSCESEPTRRTGHLLLFWGFVGAAVTSGLLVIGIYIQGMELPIPLLHPYKILGNLSALALVVGGAQLVMQRYGAGKRLVSSSAFDNFFLWVVVLVIATGVIIEAGRYFLPAGAAYGLYTVHLGVVLTLFLTFPYSKFAHMLYRVLALVHQRMVQPGRDAA